jgi:hypothetical protein
MIYKELGLGSYGMVAEGVHLNTGTKVAIKRLNNIF